MSTTRKRAAETERHPHPVAAIFPMMPAAELRELADDIRARGLRDPIVLQGDLIVDGRNRLAACEIAGVKPTFSQWRKSGKADTVAAYIVSKNVHRRHLTTSERGSLAAKLVRLGAFPNLESSAEAVHVSTQTAYHAAAVEEKGSKALVEAVDAGEVAVSAAAEIAELPKREQTAHVKAGTVAKAAKEQRARKAQARRPTGRAAVETLPVAALDTKRLAQRQREWKALGLAVNKVEEALRAGGFLRDKGEPCDRSHVEESARLGRAVVSKPQVYAATVSRVAAVLAVLADVTREAYS